MNQTLTSTHFCLRWYGSCTFRIVLVFQQEYGVFENSFVPTSGEMVVGEGGSHNQFGSIRARRWAKAKNIAIQILCLLKSA